MTENSIEQKTRFLFKLYYVHLELVKLNTPGRMAFVNNLQRLQEFVGHLSYTDPLMRDIVNGNSDIPEPDLEYIKNFSVPFMSIDAQQHVYVLSIGNVPYHVIIDQVMDYEYISLLTRAGILINYILHGPNNSKDPQGSEIDPVK